MCVRERESRSGRLLLVKGIQVNNINFIDDDDDANIRKLTLTLF